MSREKLPTEFTYIGKGLKYRKTGSDIFCTNCWTHWRFFTGGGSWSPDLCPCGCEDTTVWYKMGPLQRRKAQKKYDKDLEKWRKRNQ